MPQLRTLPLRAPAARHPTAQVAINLFVFLTAPFTPWKSTCEPSVCLSVWITVEFPEHTQ